MITVEMLDHEIDCLIEEDMTWSNVDRLCLLLSARHKLACYHHDGHNAALGGLDESTAREWVDSMRHTADGATGPHWTMEQTNQVLQQRGWSFDRAEFYAIINSLWSDYGKTAQKYGVDKTDFWADLAHDWLDDADANEDKAELYYRHIAK